MLKGVRRCHCLLQELKQFYEEENTVLTEHLTMFSFFIPKMPRMKETSVKYTTIPNIRNKNQNTNGKKLQLNCRTQPAMQIS